MGILKDIENVILPIEKRIESHLKGMNMSCHRLVLIDSCLWGAFIIYYIGHFFYSKQFKKFEKEHKGYEKLMKEKDVIIITFLLLALLLYFHVFVISKGK